jgi:hypothetical protein
MVLYNYTDQALGDWNKSIGDMNLFLIEKIKLIS